MQNHRDTNYDSFTFSVISSFANFDKTYTYGNSFDFGDFDRCVDIEHKSKNESIGTFRGKHCLVQYYPTETDVKEIPPSKFSAYVSFCLTPTLWFRYKWLQFWMEKVKHKICRCRLHSIFMFIGHSHAVNEKHFQRNRLDGGNRLHSVRLLPNTWSWNDSVCWFYSDVRTSKDWQNFFV